MIDAVTLLLWLLALPLTLASLYLLTMTLLSRAPLSPSRCSRQLRFEVVVPAHNEAAVIAAVIASVDKLDWPADNFRITVIADNCTDATAALARNAGAKVLERFDITKRGKGYALAFAFAESQTRGWADAVVVVDADSEISSNLLTAFAARLETGAGVVQAYYGVLNPQTSWRTRLLAIAFSAFHRVRSRARECLQLSAGIRGNGWCISHELLRRVPYQAFSLTEDIEYGIALGLAGYRVHYADDATVAGLMVNSESASRSQRQRWEGGRWQLIRSHFLSLLGVALFAPRQRQANRGRVFKDSHSHNNDGRVCLDLALDLLMPPLSYIVLNLFLLLVLAALVSVATSQFSAFLWLGIACGFCITLYVLRGWQLSGVGYAGLVDLLRAPAFVAWKLWLLCTHRSLHWVRTKREST